MRLASSLILVVAFLLSACSASGSTVYNGGSAGTGSKVSLTVHITKADGIVWGKVTGVRSGKPDLVCQVATCHYSLKRGTVLVFHQVPVNSSTWPFKNWTLKEMGKRAKQITPRAVRLVITKPTVLKAVYVLQQ